MVNKVQKKAFYVGSIVVLVGHYCDATITKVFRAFVALSHVQTHCLRYVHYFLILCNLLQSRFPHIQHLTLKRENPVFVPSYYLYTCHG